MLKRWTALLLAVMLVLLTACGARCVRPLDKEEIR